MKFRVTGMLAMAIALAGMGCAGDVDTTDDSVRMEAEVPRVETGPADTDLDPTTDDDVDIDTPLPGDR